MSLILGIVGEIATGKSTVTDYLKTHYGATTFRFSDVLRDVLQRVRVEPTRNHMQQLSTFLRATYGEDILSKNLARDVSEAAEPIIITEGVRRLTDIAHLRELDGFHLIAIDTDSKIRFDRLTKRSENPDDQHKTWEQFVEEGAQESEQQIRTTMSEAETTLHNNGTMPELYAQIDSFMHQYGIKRKD